MRTAPLAVLVAAAAAAVPLLRVPSTAAFLELVEAHAALMAACWFLWFLSAHVLIRRVMLLALRNPQLRQRGLGVETK